jgi:hypothetical protein
MCNAHNHPPGCACGWGGESHLGSGGGDYGGARFSKRIYTYSERFKDICYPTKCPINGCEPVWFIRHNGGSVWVDALGWPWPKHACFDEPENRISYACIATLANNQSGATALSLALLNRISHIGSQLGPKLQIGCLDGSLIVARGVPGLDYYQLLGELVICSHEAGLLRHSQLGDFPITILPDTRFEDEPFPYHFHRDSELKTKCPLCSGYYYEDEHEEHLEHCSRTFQQIRSKTRIFKNSIACPKPQKEWVACPKCKCSVEKRHLDGHLNDCSGTKPKPLIQKLHDSTTRESTIMSEIRVRNESREERIRSEIRRVTKEAWLVSDVSKDSDENFSLVKQEAIRLIRGLSPHVRREVEHHFTSQKWSPLLKYL